MRRHARKELEAMSSKELIEVLDLYRLPVPLVYTGPTNPVIIEMILRYESESEDGKIPP